MIQINKLSKKYKGAEAYALQEISLSINKGEVFGLLGPNGAGKTTLISILSSLYKPSSGTFTIDGLTYKKNRSAIKQSIGIVPQEYALYSSLTAYENLSYFGSMYGLSGRILKETIHEHLQAVGLKEFMNKKISTYSGGMKRRVNLVAGLLHNPKVLFLDEPTVGVDVQSKKAIFTYLRAVNQAGTTIVYTSHHLNEAEDFCTRVAIIDHGSIISIGTPKELILKEKNAHNLEDVFIALTGKTLRDYA